MAILTTIHKDHDTTEITSPFSITLANIIFDESPSFKFNVKKYMQWYNALDKNYKKFFPGAQEIIAMFSMAGFNQIKNYDELIEKLNKFSDRDIYSGEKIGMISFDTNVYSFGVPKVVYEYIRSLNKRNVGILLIKNVRDEINRIWNETRHKYKSNALLTTDEEIRRTFLNQPIPKGITFRLASIYEQYLANQIDVRQSTVDIKDDNNDIAIVREIISHEQYDPILITEDGDLEQLAYGYKLKVIRVLGNHSVNNLRKEYKISWEQLRDMIYYMSIYMGAIMISGYQINGLWNGKTANDWTNELVKISSSNIDTDIKIILKIE